MQGFYQIELLKIMRRALTGKYLLPVSARRRRNADHLKRARVLDRVEDMSIGSCVEVKKLILQHFSMLFAHNSM